MLSCRFCLYPVAIPTSTTFSFIHARGLMKVAGNGQGKILTPEELRRLFAEGFTLSLLLPLSGLTFLNHIK